MALNFPPRSLTFHAVLLQCCHTFLGSVGLSINTTDLKHHQNTKSSGGLPTLLKEQKVPNQTYSIQCQNIFGGKYIKCRISVLQLFKGLIYVYFKIQDNFHCSKIGPTNRLWGNQHKFLITSQQLLIQLGYEHLKILDGYPRYTCQTKPKQFGV